MPKSWVTINTYIIYYNYTVYEVTNNDVTYINS